MASRKVKSTRRDPFNRIVGPCAESVSQYAATRAAALLHAPDLFEPHVLAIICELADNSVCLPWPRVHTEGQPERTHVTGPGQFVQTESAVILPLPTSNTAIAKGGTRVRTCKCGRRIQLCKDMYPVGREAAHFAHECGLWGCGKVVCPDCFDYIRKQCASHTDLVWKEGATVKIKWDFNRTSM
jgi:hypothetical protein